MCARFRLVRPILVLVLFTAASLSAAERPRPGTAELRARLMPVYQELVGDVTYINFVDQLATQDQDPAFVDQYLRFLPISPEVLLELDMIAKRYEHMVPEHIVRWHLRWVQLNEELARDHFGDREVDEILERLRPQVLVPPEQTVADIVAPGTGPLRGATVGTNRNSAATFGTTPVSYQGEIQIVVNPNNPMQLVSSANSFDSSPAACDHGTQAIFYSSDGGVTWGYTCAPDLADWNASGLSTFPACANPFGSDPALAWSTNGDVFLEYLFLCGSGTTRYAIVVARSTDGGVTWAPHGVVINSWATPGVIEDKQFYEIDENAGSPFEGRHYTCWDRSNNERFAFSTDNGVNWTEVDLPNTPGFDLGCEIAVEKNGTVHVIYDSLTCAATCSNEEMYYMQSTDGGATWSTPLEIVDFNLVGFSNANLPGPQNRRGINPFGAIDVDNSGGPCDGHLYVTFSDWTAGGAATTDVWLIRSTDDGANWSAPLRINDDGAGGNAQFHPFLVVDQSNGDVIVSWHDARNDVANRAVDFFVARSTDCGLSMEPNIQASQPSAEFNNAGISSTNLNTFSNTLANVNQHGEYMGLDVLNGTAYLAWSDSRHFFPASTGDPQRENVGFAAVSFVDPTIFADGFESGDVSAWTFAVP